ncbi:hypothetical protein HMPREF0577_1910 [Mobiluncus mulieris ATCC 35243]|nr:hypothetical protein HMPREF0577_1910 [Mobiluncus mulieris ATCC 35243]
MGLVVVLAEIKDFLGVRLCIFESHPQFFLNFCQALFPGALVEI